MEKYRLEPTESRLQCGEVPSLIWLLLVYLSIGRAAGGNLKIVDDMVLAPLAKRCIFFAGYRTDWGLATQRGRWYRAQHYCSLLYSPDGT